MPPFSNPLKEFHTFGQRTEKSQEVIFFTVSLITVRLSRNSVFFVFTHLTKFLFFSTDIAARVASQHVVSLRAAVGAAPGFAPNSLSVSIIIIIFYLLRLVKRRQQIFHKTVLDI